MTDYDRRAGLRRRVDAERNLTLIGLQALLIGRALEDRQAILNETIGARAMPTLQERGFFDIRARYGATLHRLERQFAEVDRLSSAKRESPSIAGVIGSRLSGLQIIGPDDPGAPIDTSFDPGDGPATDTGEEMETQDLAFDQYPSDVQQAAQTYFDANATPLLTEQQRRVVREVGKYVAAGGKAGGAPKAADGGYAEGFIDDNGDLNIGKINDALTVIAVGASLGIGGVAGAALGALAYIVVPRMLTAIEEEIGDLLVGSLPGF